MSKTLLIIIVGLSIGTAQAQVYKCQGANGKTLISDTPCPTANQTVQVRRVDSVTPAQIRQAREVKETLRQHLHDMQYNTPPERGLQRIENRLEYQRQQQQWDEWQAKQQLKQADLRRKQAEDEKTRQTSEFYVKPGYAYRPFQSPSYYPSPNETLPPVAPPPVWRSPPPPSRCYYLQPRGPYICQ